MITSYDDARYTVIRFPSGLAHTSAPALFAVDTDGQKPLPVEYTTYAVPGKPEHGEFYVTRGLYPWLQLRDGAGGMVTIVRLPQPGLVYKEQAHAQ